MERLTERSLDYCTQLCSDEDAISCAFYKGEQEEKCWRANMYDRLAAYEDLEEQGHLIALPCKVGDRVWDTEGLTAEPSSHIVLGFDVLRSLNMAHLSGGQSLPVSELGKTVFLTREEAEKALKGVSEDA